MLAPGVRTLARPTQQRARPRPRAIPQRVQLRPRSHRAPHPRTRARRHRLRRPQDDHREMTNRRYISGLGRPRSASQEVPAAASRRRAGRGGLPIGRKLELGALEGPGALALELDRGGPAVCDLTADFGEWRPLVESDAVVRRQPAAVAGLRVARLADDDALAALPEARGEEPALRLPLARLVADADRALLDREASEVAEDVLRPLQVAADGLVAGDGAV